MRCPKQIIFFILSVFILHPDSDFIYGQSGALNISYTVDPFTRLVHVTYRVPSIAPDSIQISVEARNNSEDEWRPARVQKYRSATGGSLCPESDWDDGMLRGSITEYNAESLSRTFIWYPYPEFEEDGRVAATLRITIKAGAEKVAGGETVIVQDNSDVIYIEDWSAVLQEEFVSESPEEGTGVWWFHGGIGSEKAPVGKRILDVTDKGISLPQLTAVLNLRGKYAVYACLPHSLSAIELRLSGDERSQFFSSRRYREEQFWKIAPMNFQNIIVSQPYRTVYEFEDEYRARLDYLKLVPVKNEMADLYSEKVKGSRDKLVMGYNEPYSWAFHENVQSNIRHREPLLAFREAWVDIVDVQISRLGMRPVYETRNEEPLYWGTRGDPVRGAVPETFNVGRMQQYTNTLQTQLKYARELGMTPFANIGAGNSYPGSPLQGEFAAEHPEWHEGAQLRYDVPEVREHMLNFYREALEIGARGISIDFCRYPHGVAGSQVATGFLRDLRKIADIYSAGDSDRVKISVRFPAHGVINWERFDYDTWCAENLIDYLCPSNIQGRHLNFNIAPYIKAVQGRGVKLCPVVDALSWGLTRPGGFLLRVRDLYRAGADGVYIYQCDGAVLDGERARDMVRLCGSSEALERYFRGDSLKTEKYGRDIYLKPPTRGASYSRWERLRFWIDGVRPEEVLVYLDGELINHFSSPPYWAGTEDYESDTLLSGDHTLAIRVKYGDRFLEKTFSIEGE